VREILLAAASILVAASTAALSQGLPPGMTMHRVQAGTLDADGWTVAASTAGHFSVKLPCLFNDFTSQEQDPIAPVMTAYSVGCLRSDQRKFSATRVVYRRGAAAAEEFFARIRSGRGWETADSVTPLTFKSFDAVTIADSNNSRCGFLRFILVNADIVALTAEAPRVACEGLKEQSETFFASVQLDAPDKQ
jgi:hypothetical protein